ncbi:hypothetical protein YC2023_096635 [Brassica napus]
MEKEMAVKRWVVYVSSKIPMESMLLHAFKTRLNQASVVVSPLRLYMAHSYSSRSNTDC